MSDITYVENCFDQECEAGVKELLVIFQIYFGVPRCTIKIVVCCDVQCESRDLCEDTRNMHH